MPVILHFPKQDRIIRIPLPHRIELEEIVEKLVGCEVRAHDADVSHEYSPGDTSQVPKDVGVDSAVLGPELDAPEGRAEGLRVRHKLKDNICDSAPVQGTDGLMVAVTEDVVVVQVGKIVSHTLVLYAGEQ